jgi:hypothetical protein
MGPYAVGTLIVDEVGTFMSGDLLQSRPEFTLPNDEFVFDASKSASPKKPVSHVCNLPPYCLFTGGKRIRTCHSQAYRGNHMR